MISGLASSGSITISGGTTGMPYISSNPNNPIQGMIRINGTNIEAFDGSVWIAVNTSCASIELSDETEALLDWAREKRTEEQRLQDMMDKYPALKKAKDNFDILLNLVKDDYK